MKDLLTPQADVKWRAAGTGAVPVLVNALAKQTGLLDIAYSNAWARMPVSIQSNLPAPIDSKTIRMAAAGLLADPKIGTNIPIPALTNALMDKSWPVRFNVLACLANVVLPNAGSEKAQLLPQILMASTDPEMMVRMQAFNCLGFYKEQSEEIVPTLTKALGDNYPDVRIRAAMAFHEVNPAAAEKAGALSVAINCLHSDGPNGSKFLATKFLNKLGKLPSNEKN